MTTAIHDPSWRCPAHEDLIREVAETRSVAEQTLATVTRIEARQYRSAGAEGRHAGAVAAVAKALGIGLAGLSLLVAAATLAWSVIHG
jgi:hypothetical protein